MIDIRKKRQAFHQTIRTNQRDAIKKLKRQQFAQQQLHQEFLNALKQPFSFCNNWEEERRNFWANGPSNRQDYYSCAFHFIDETSQTLKDLLLRFETDPDAKLDISYHLIENLPFLVPPPHVDLDELPKSFIELCMFILKNPQLDISDKENFIQSFPHDTIARCLLKYFAQNWVQIKKNKCGDIVMNFFVEFNKHKNLFTQRMYNDQNYQFLLEQTIKEIFDLTSAQISLYNSWNTLQNQFGNQDYENDQGPNIQSSTQHEYSDQERIFLVIKYATFLSNILLLSPTPNFNIKQVKNKLNAIAFYLYRKILLNEYDAQFRIQAQFCVSTLLGFTCQAHLDKQIQVITTILNSQIKRIQSEKYQNCHTGDDIEIDQKVFSKEENLHGEDIIEKDESSLAYLSRMSLLMICNMAQNSMKLKYKHVQKWLNYQMRLKDQSIFKLQNSEIIKRFLSLLKKLIRNEKKFPETYKSYSYNRQSTNERQEQVFRIKASICKLIDRKGFEQLMKNKGIKEYKKEMCHLLCTLMDGMDEFGDVSGIVLSLFRFGNSWDESNMGSSFEYEEDEIDSSDEEYEETKQNNILSAIRVFIFKLSMQFLQKTYKYLPYEHKQQLMLHLVNSDNLSQEQVNKYLTLEERLKFKKHAEFSWENYNSDEDQCFACQEQYETSHENQRFGYENEREGIPLAQEGKSNYGNSQQTQV